MIDEIENLILKEVNEMKMPGFNAEASLYKTSERYHMVVPLSQTEEAIYPQLVDKECFDDCHVKCIMKHCPQGG
jgi:hypothetical protein